MAAARVFTISPAAPFVATFVEAFLAGAIVPGFPDPRRPFGVAQATLFVPTRRAGRALADALRAGLGRATVLLPRIVPLGHLESIETDSLLDEETEGAPAAATQTVTDIERRLILMRLIARWAEELQQAIVEESDAVPRAHAPLVATTPAQVWHLAGELANLLDEFVTDELSPEALRTITPREYDAYWSITLQFLEIALTQWPAILRERGFVDRAAHRLQRIDAQIAGLRLANSERPCLVLGSTGANTATRRLMAAAAQAPRGAVVLPGLDLDLDAASWEAISGDAERLEPAVGHPQFVLKALLRTLGIERADVVELGTAHAGLRTRMRWVGEALRPAETTDQWHGRGADEAAPQAEAALAKVTLIEAADEREEALCLALRLRETLERPHCSAALVTPDRDLARRVRAELLRWNVAIADSAGELLARTPAAILAKLLLGAAADEPRQTDCMAILTHADAAFDLAPDQRLRCTAQIEIAVLRALGNQQGDIESVLARARAAALERDAAALTKTLIEDDWTAMRDLLARYDHCLAPLRQPSGKANLAEWVAAHREALSRATRGGGREDDRDRIMLDATFAHFETPDAHALPLGRHDYAALFDAVVGSVALRAPVQAQPRLQILGLLEARLLPLDVVVLGGLDEAIWPPQPRGDPFLNRPMRADLGLPSPDRRIGQTAHDFTQLLGHAEVVLSRARKRGGSPTVPSRFLQRMAALAGVDAWEACRRRGATTLTYAARIDARAPRHIRRPNPKPPLALRPTSLSVTRIETLRRDPYAIYAAHILKLQPLNPLDAMADARVSGILLHDLLARFSQRTRAGDALDAAKATLLTEARERFADLLREPSFRTFRWPRIAEALAAFADWHGARRGAATRVAVETSGVLHVPLSDGSTFTLRARADRIEVRAGGALALVDYKTGRMPSESEIKAGFAPQMPLEAAMLRAGAFTDIAAGRVEEAIFLKVGGADGVEARPATKSDLEALAAQHLDDLRVLLDEFRDEANGYLARPYPQYAYRFGTYDHLARVREWLAQEEGDTP